MNKFGFALFSSLFIALGIFISSCGDNLQDGSSVYFNEAITEITTDNLSDVEVSMIIDPASEFSSSIHIKVSSDGGSANEAFQLIPNIIGDSIIVPVNEGDTSASFTISPIAEGMGYDDIDIEFEISSVDSGLYISDKEDIIGSLSIINTKSAGSIALPYFEDFSTMQIQSTLYPEGWREYIASQHSLGEAHWYFSNDPANVLEIDSWSFDGATNDPAEVWIISPRISFLKVSNPTLKLVLDRRLETWDPNSGNRNPIDFQEYDFFISTDYNGVNVEEATWEVYQPLVDAWESNDPDDDILTNAGPFDLSKYEGELVSFAFVYYAESQAAATILRFGSVEIEEAK